MNIQPPASLCRRQSDLTGGANLPQVTIDSLALSTRFGAIGKPCPKISNHGHAYSHFLVASRAGAIEKNHLEFSNVKIRAAYFLRSEAHFIASTRFHQTEDQFDGANKLLAEDRYLRPDKVKREKKAFDDLVQEENLDRSERKIDCSEARENFLRLTTECREGALGLQLHITKCSQVCVES